MGVVSASCEECESRGVSPVRRQPSGKFLVGGVPRGESAVYRSLPYSSFIPIQSKSFRDSLLNFHDKSFISFYVMVYFYYRRKLQKMYQPLSLSSITKVMCEEGKMEKNKEAKAVASTVGFAY
jgi:hypothetical protein